MLTWKKRQKQLTYIQEKTSASSMNASHRLCFIWMSMNWVRWRPLLRPEAFISSLLSFSWHPLCDSGPKAGGTRGFPRVLSLCIHRWRGELECKLSLFSVSHATSLLLWTEVFFLRVLLFDCWVTRMKLDDIGANNVFLRRRRKQMSS